MFILMTLNSISMSAQSRQRYQRQNRTSNSHMTRGWHEQIVKKPKDKYTPGEKFPEGGYKIASLTGNIYIKGFQDNDTCYCLIYPDSRYNEARCYYFIILDHRAMMEIILEGLHTHEKSKTECRLWVTNLLKELNADEAANTYSSNNPWTKYRPRQTMEEQRADIYGSGFSPLTYKKAIEAYKMQRHGISNMELIGALILSNMLSGNSGKLQYSCSICGQRFSDYSVMRSHENSTHGY